MAQIATIPPAVANELKRFKTNSAPLICQIDKRASPPALKIDSTVLDEDEEFSIETLASNLPDGAPRFVVLAYKPSHEDFPKVVLINWIPTGCEPASSMLHVGTLPAIERLTRYPKARRGLTQPIKRS
ncbi:hypothetical protein FRC18_006245 [Serendipita sp. 400]|nr:hypothetical protein FRC18_006245 [Serendipita sp. 400]